MIQLAAAVGFGFSFGDAGWHSSKLDEFSLWRDFGGQMDPSESRSEMLRLWAIYRVAALQAIPGRLRSTSTFRATSWWMERTEYYSDDMAGVGGFGWDFCVADDNIQFCR